MGSKGISVHFPLKIEKGEGIVPIREDNIIEAVKFQLKNLILTRPGEKISDPEFGVGLSNFLFSQENIRIPEIQNRIRSQISRYMNYFDNLEINVGRSTENNKTIAVKIRFKIAELKINDELEVSV